MGRVLNIRVESKFGSSTKEIRYLVYGACIPLGKKPDRLTFFFSNPKVSSTKLIAPHYKQTAQRVYEREAKYILAVHGQMRLKL